MLGVLWEAVCMKNPEITWMVDNPMITNVSRWKLKSVLCILKTMASYSMITCVDLRIFLFL